jgi:hypothetical protein
MDDTIADPAASVRRGARQDVAGSADARRTLHLADELPMTVTGTIQEFVVREQAIELLGLHDAAAVDTA